MNDHEFLLRLADSVCGVSSFDVQRLRQIAETLKPAPVPAACPAPSFGGVLAGSITFPDGTTITTADAVADPDDYEDMISLDGDSDPYHNVGNAD